MDISGNLPGQVPGNRQPPSQEGEQNSGQVREYSIVQSTECNPAGVMSGWSSSASG